MTPEHRTQILLRHYGNPIEYHKNVLGDVEIHLIDSWDGWLVSRILEMPENFRLPVYSLEDITDEDLYAIGKILLHEDSWNGFAEGVFIHCAKGWIKEYQKAERAIRGGMVSMPLDLAVLDFLRSRQYATPQTVVIPKPEEEDYDVLNVEKWPLPICMNLHEERKQMNLREREIKEAYEKALDKRKKQPTKTYSVDELIKEGVYNLIEIR